MTISWIHYFMKTFLLPSLWYAFGITDTEWVPQTFCRISQQAWNSLFGDFQTIAFAIFLNDGRPKILKDFPTKNSKKYWHSSNLSEKIAQNITAITAEVWLTLSNQPLNLTITMPLDFPDENVDNYLHESPSSDDPTQQILDSHDCSEPTPPEDASASESMEHSLDNNGVLPLREDQTEVTADNDSLEECTICTERKNCFTLQPCNHGSFCLNCVCRLETKTCPLCRQHVDQVRGKKASSKERVWSLDYYRNLYKSFEDLDMSTVVRVAVVGPDAVGTQTFVRRLIESCPIDTSGSLFPTRYSANCSMAHREMRLTPCLSTNLEEAAVGSEINDVKPQIIVYLFVNDDSETKCVYWNHTTVNFGDAKHLYVVMTENRLFCCDERYFVEGQRRHALKVNLSLSRESFKDLFEIIYEKHSMNMSE